LEQNIQLILPKHLVFATNAVAGEIWTREGRFALSHMAIIGSQIRKLYPSPQPRARAADPMYDRHVRLFGDLGQEILSQLKVGIIGLGGGGSLLNQSLSHLGVGQIIGIDFDRVELSNRSRIVGTTPWDVIARLAKHPHPWLKQFAKNLSSYKVRVARRVAKQANPSIKYDAVIGNIVDESTAFLLRDVDFLFLATDTMQSRLVFNALVYQYLIPGIQVGAKIPVNQKTREVGEIFTVTRPILPFAGGGCLHCHEVIIPSKLQEEALSDEERKAQRYVDDEEIAEPSVITLNVESVAQALNDFLMMFTGLYHPSVDLNHQISFIRERVINNVGSKANSFCLDCSLSQRSRLARGDRHRLPCRHPLNFSIKSNRPIVASLPPDG
jgi:ThiF family